MATNKQFVQALANGSASQIPMGIYPTQAQEVLEAHGILNQMMDEVSMQDVTVDGVGEEIAQQLPGADLEIQAFGDQNLIPADVPQQEEIGMLEEKGAQAEQTPAGKQKKKQR